MSKNRPTLATAPPAGPEMSKIMDSPSAAFGHRTFMEDWELAVQAAQERRALDTIVLNIGQVSTFTEQFVICHGTNSRQVQAIADSVSRGLKTHGRRPLRIEGYQNAEWILLDYGDFVVHVFSRDKRYYYDLERLWRAAPKLPVPVAA